MPLVLRAQAWASAGNPQRAELRKRTPQTVPDVHAELLPPKKHHHQLLQLHPRFPASAEEGDGSATGHARLPQGSSETVSQEGPQAASSAPAFSQRRSQPGENQDANCGQRQPPRERSPSHASDGSGPRKRKYPLLPRRRGEPLSLPPPPEPGFRVTDKDLDAEKRAVLQRINRALRGETEATSGCGAAEAGKADLSAGPPKPSAHAPSSAPVQGCAKGSPTAAGPTPAAAGASPNTSILKPTWGPPQNGGQGGPLQSQSKASRISAARGASSAFPAGPSKSRMEAPVPMQVDSPVSYSGGR